MTRYLPSAQMPENDDVHDVDKYDQYVGSRVRFPIGDEIRTGKVMRCKHACQCQCHVGQKDL
jgi:hypothetical protein